MPLCGECEMGARTGTGPHGNPNEGPHCSCFYEGKREGVEAAAKLLRGAATTWFDDGQTDRADDADMYADQVLALTPGDTEQGYERGLKAAAEECLRVWREAENQTAQNVLSHGCIASEKAILALLPEPEKEELRVIEMCLCEAPHLMLKPDVLYRFVVGPGCEACAHAAQSAKSGPEKVGWFSGKADLDLLKKFQELNPKPEPLPSDLTGMQKIERFCAEPNPDEIDGKGASGGSSWAPWERKPQPSDLCGCGLTRRQHEPDVRPSWLREHPFEEPKR